MKKLIFTIVIVANFLPLYARADLFDLGNPGEVASDMMKQLSSDLGLDMSEVKNLAETLNVSRQKEIPPQITLTFNPSNPSPGEKLTALAQPTYFLNDPKKLYYTWYLKHKNCDKAKKGDSDYEEKCDLNDDDEVDEEDWKIEATRILASNDFSWDTADYSKDTDEDGYDAIFGGEDQRGKDIDQTNSHCFAHNNETGNEYELPDCKHLFPNAPSDKTGDDAFGKSEESFWHTDPKNADTAATGNNDEANVTGLGMLSFTWNYKEGDKVGLVIEGTSLDPTQQGDSSYKTMWAFSKNTCELDDYITSATDSDTQATATTRVVNPNTGDTTVTDTIIETRISVNQPKGIIITETKKIKTTVTVYDPLNVIISGPTITYIKAVLDPDTVPDPTADTEKEKSMLNMKTNDLNECLEKNLVSPIEGGQADKIDVKLSYLPETPMNDPAGENSDTLALLSSVFNVKNSNYLKYAWEIFATEENTPSPGDGWGSPLLKTEIPDVSQTIGIGLSTLKFKLAFPNTVKYLKAKLVVTEKISSETTREGHTDIIIPLSSTSDKIQVFSTAVSPDLVLSLVHAERCDTGLDSALCPVVQNEIVGLKVDKENFTDFVWTLDGDPIQPLNYQRADGKECVSGECDPKTGEATNIAFFPVLKEKEATYDIGLTAVNIKGEKVTLTKKFEVADPEIKIISPDFNACQPVLLGNYVDLDSKQWPDYSDKDFQASPGSTISLQPILNNPFAQNLIWYIDGIPMTPENLPLFGATMAADGTLAFPAAKQLGEIYNVSVQALYAQSNNIKKFLYQAAGVQLNEFLEMTISDNIEIQMADLAGTSGAKTSAPRKFLAAIFTGLPVYVSFLFRIVLTVMLILAVSWITMSFTPRVQEE